MRQVERNQAGLELFLRDKRGENLATTAKHSEIDPKRCKGASRVQGHHGAAKTRAWPVLNLLRPTPDARASRHAHHSGFDAAVTPSQARAWALLNLL